MKETAREINEAVVLGKETEIGINEVQDDGRDNWRITKGHIILEHASSGHFYRQQSFGAIPYAASICT